MHENYLYVTHSVASFGIVVFYFKANHTANEKSNSENSWEELYKDHLHKLILLGRLSRQLPVVLSGKVNAMSHEGRKQKQDVRQNQTYPFVDGGAGHVSAQIVADNVFSSFSASKATRISPNDLSIVPGSSSR